MDHRWGVRFAVDLPVLLIYPTRAIGMGRMTEMSTSGALVRTDFAPPDLVSIQIAGVPVERESEGFDSIDAFVVRHESHAIAVEWTHFSPLPVRVLLARFVLRPNAPQ